MMKAINTGMLMELIKAAKSRNYNRQLPDDVQPLLDPEGVHVFAMILIHEHAQRVRVTPHMRCQAMLKLQDMSDPLQLILDVPAFLWHSWPSADEVAARVRQDH